MPLLRVTQGKSCEGYSVCFDLLPVGVLPRHHTCGNNMPVARLGTKIYEPLHIKDRLDTFITIQLVSTTMAFRYTTGHPSQWQNWNW